MNSVISFVISLCLILLICKDSISQILQTQLNEAWAIIPMPFLGIKRFVANLTLYSCSVLTSPFHREGKQCVFFYPFLHKAFWWQKHNHQRLRNANYTFLALFAVLVLEAAAGVVWEKNTAGWLVAAAGVVWEKNTVGWCWSRTTE